MDNPFKTTRTHSELVHIGPLNVINAKFPPVPLTPPQASDIGWPVIFSPKPRSPLLKNFGTAFLLVPDKAYLSDSHPMFGSFSSGCSHLMSSTLNKTFLGHLF